MPQSPAQFGLLAVSLSLLIIPFATPLSFNFPTISSGDSRFINCTGNSTLTPQGIQITPEPDTGGPIGAYQWNTGRATYSENLRLWDAGKLSDFSTHFSFVVRKAAESDLGQGLAFFLAPAGTSFPPGSSGGRLGLARPGEERNGQSHFVAVEFDTYRNNEWEPNLSLNHVGILINSLSSVANTTWPSNFLYEREHQAWINYDSDSRNLSVEFNSFNEDGTGGPRTSLYYIVDLRNHLPEWVTFGFTASTDEVFEENNIRSWEFNSNMGGNQTNIGLIIGITVGSFVLVCILGSVWFFWKKNKKKKEKHYELPIDSTMDAEFERGVGPKKYSYRELARATKNFSDTEKLGEGGFGGVYKGFLKDLNSEVAIKRISEGSQQGVREYKSEVMIISRFRHRNLVQLIGWCHEKRELLLVYEFLPNGSLDLHLFKEKSVLKWEERFKIAKGLASGLLYLHEEGEQYVLHRDIKSSNVMLDSGFNAKLGDFGLAQLVDHENRLSKTDLAGTIGYMPFEYVMTRKATKESDVYSFGVVAMEIATGRRPGDFSGNPTMVGWVWELYGTGKILEAADPKISGDFDKEEMERLLTVGLWCAHPDYRQRPSIRQAVLVLNLESQLPVLPAKMPPMPQSFGPDSSTSATSSVASSSTTSFL